MPLKLTLRTLKEQSKNGKNSNRWKIVPDIQNSLRSQKLSWAPRGNFHLTYNAPNFQCICNETMIIICTPIFHALRTSICPGLLFFIHLLHFTCKKIKPFKYIHINAPEILLNSSQTFESARSLLKSTSVAAAVPPVGCCSPAFSTVASIS